MQASTYFSAVNTCMKKPKIACGAPPPPHKSMTTWDAYIHYISSEESDFKSS